MGIATFGEGNRGLNCSRQLDFYMGKYVVVTGHLCCFCWASKLEDTSPRSLLHPAFLAGLCWQ